MGILHADVPGAQYTYLLQIYVKYIIYIKYVTRFLTLYLNQSHLFMFNLTKILFAGILGDESDYGNGYGIAFAREQASSCCYLTLLSWRKETMTSPSDVRSRRHLYPLSGARVLMLLILLGVLVFGLTVRTARAATGQAFVRVNQVGYATTASKRAYLMASGVETGLGSDKYPSHRQVSEHRLWREGVMGVHQRQRLSILPGWQGPKLLRVS